jgi:hypothetical protein
VAELSLTIHPDAYSAYDQYLKKKFKTRPMHYFHTVKKGILNLMQDKARLWEAERYLISYCQTVCPDCPIPAQSPTLCEVPVD